MKHTLMLGVCLFIILTMVPSLPMPVYGEEISPIRKSADLRARFINDLHRASAVLRRLSPAVSFFGGSRIAADDPAAEKARETGRLLAAFRIPPCTGGGSGIMKYVPQGYVEALSMPVRDDMRTQGFTVKLPYETEMNSYIQVSAEFDELAFRKYALFICKRGYGFFPGGFGTEDEFFEAWNSIAGGDENVPVALMERAFWMPQLQALQKVAVRDRSLITERDMASIMSVVTDEPSEMIRILGSRRWSCGGKKPGRYIEGMLENDIADAINAYSASPPAVVFMGSSRLRADDGTCAAARKIACRLAENKILLRTLNGGTVAESVITGAGQAAAPAEVQCFLVREEAVQGNHCRVKNMTSVRSPLIHKTFAGRDLLALVVLPGDTAVLSELFGTICLMQCGVIGRKPIILLGSDYWEPLFAAVKSVMVTKTRALIDPGDMSLVTITDDCNEAYDRIMTCSSINMPLPQVSR